jgi:pimeloyl-ACP methyl ester carboxylesterase
VAILKQTADRTADRTPAPKTDRTESEPWTAGQPWTASGPEDGPPIVFVHGAIVGAIWGPQVERLRDRYRCIIVDLPGHGRLAAERFTIPRAVEVITAAIDAAAGGRALVVGLSLGGYSAMALAGAHPDRVRGLVVADASREPVGLATVAMLAYGWTLRWLPRRLVRAVGVGLFRRSYGRALSAELASDYGSRAGGIGVIALAGQQFRDRLRAYGGPVLILNGALDWFFISGEAAFVDGLDNVTVRRIPGASHLSNLDRPDEFTAEIVAFEASIPT